MYQEIKSFIEALPSENADKYLELRLKREAFVVTLGIKAAIRHIWMTVQEYSVDEFFGVDSSKVKKRKISGHGVPGNSSTGS